MHKDEIKGHLKETEGRVQEGIGRGFGIPEHEIEGENKQMEGEFDQVKGRVKNALHRMID